MPGQTALSVLTGKPLVSTPAAMHAVLNSCEMIIWERDGQIQALSSVSAKWETIGAAIHAVPISLDLNKR